MLDVMQDKHRFMVRALTHRYRRDRGDAFIDDMRRRIDTLRAALRDDRQVAAVVITRDEPMVVAETNRYLENLRRLQIQVAAVVANAVDADVVRTTSNTPAADYSIPRASPPPNGLNAAADLVARMQSRGTTSERVRHLDRAAGEVVTQSGELLDDHSRLAALVGVLTIVGGKGGVGKSTVACALALAAVDADQQPTLLVSTDPAPSIADALGATEEPWARSDGEHGVDGADGLVVRQMNAGTAFARVRDEYQSRIDAVFDGLVGGGMDVSHDRAIVRDLLALAPPGIDELYALSVLGDALAEGRFTRIVVDPAPTGHLLRLLEMPALALEWTHQLMRLLLKYKDLVALGDTAAELLAFAKRTRALTALLHDPARAAVVLVSIDEPVVRGETERLAGAVMSRGIHLRAIVWNRTRQAPAPLTATPQTQQFVAREVSPAPVGLAALRRWSRSWRVLPSTN
jgi:arsenite-transporting ATPase